MDFDILDQLMLRYLVSVIYRVIQNDCRGLNSLSYTIHLRQQYMYFFI